jgi:hypothetical protein
MRKYAAYFTGVHDGAAAGRRATLRHHRPAHQQLLRPDCLAMRREREREEKYPLLRQRCTRAGTCAWVYTAQAVAMGVRHFDRVEVGERMCQAALKERVERRNVRLDQTLAQYPQPSRSVC